MAISHSPKIINNGLVICLDAENNKSYPGTGATVSDLSLLDDHALTGVSATSVVDGVTCFDCSASGKGITSIANNFTFGTSHTMICWARMKADAGLWRTLWRTTPDDHPLLVQTATNTIGYYDNDPGSFNSYGLNASSLGLVNNWAMYTLVSTAGSTTLYINDTSTSGTVSFSTSGHAHDALGNTADGGSQPFGHLAYCSVYNVVLSVNQIKKTFSALKGRFGL